MTKPEIYFFIPKEKYSDRWPKSLADNWEAFSGGANVSSYFTPIALREYGYPVQITTELPDEGIVLTHSQYLPQRWITNDKTLLICIRADYGRNHPAQMHLLQNTDQAHNAGRDMIEYLFHPGPSYYIPYWPQPGLVPRDTERGDRFENVVFVGARQNLAPELITDGWRQSMEELGLNFVKKFDRASWHDCSEADAVIAIRLMSNTRYFRKPPSKLTNAWLAGVPAILGPESAYRTLRHTEYDYLEIQTQQEALAAIRRLKEDPLLRRTMLEVGGARSGECSIAANVQRRIAFFEQFALSNDKQWRSRSWRHKSRNRTGRDFRIWIKNV